MTTEKLTPWFIGVGLTVLLAGTFGFMLGAGSATGIRDAKSAHNDGFKAGYESVFAQNHQVTARLGAKAGAKRGRISGAKTGAREGKMIGAGNVEIEQAVSSQKSAEASTSAARSAIAARKANCGVVPAAPGWCPTSDELSAYNAAVVAAEEEAAEKEKRKQERQEERESADD